MVMRRLAAVLILVRVVAAGVLVLGPWTDSPAELAGWDVERFWTLAGLRGQPWVDEPVEYPPGSVALIDTVTLGGSLGLVATHRILVMASLAVDLALATLIGRLRSLRAATLYLGLGLPLVPMGLLRFDLWAALAAVGAVALLIGQRPRWFGLAATAGALIKVWPALVVVGAAARGRWLAVWWAAVLGTVAVLVWLGWAGSVDPLHQVVSLRGATGWHVESVAGSLAVLAGQGPAELQLDAFRVGTLNPTLVLIGRAMALATMGLLVTLGLRWSPAQSGDGDDPDELGVVAVVVLGAVTALVVTAPLLSPQFLLWLTPWAALLTDGQSQSRLLAWLVGAATLMTGVVLTVFGPSGVDTNVPALVLLARDVVLVAVVVGSVWALLRPSGTPAAEEQPPPRPSSS